MSKFIYRPLGMVLSILGGVLASFSATGFRRVTGSWPGEK